jgi:hypothetical protein
MLSRIQSFAPGKKQKLKVRVLRPINPNRIRHLENDIFEVNESGMVVATIK